MAVTLEDFIARHDELTFGQSTEMGERFVDNHEFSHMRISNSFQSVEEFYSYLDGCDILNTDRLRPQWDTYFMVGQHRRPWETHAIYDTPDSSLPSRATIQLHEATRWSNSCQEQPDCLNRLQWYSSRVDQL
jgi:hypothetical protein